MAQVRKAWKHNPSTELSKSKLQTEKAWGRKNRTYNFIGLWSITRMREFGSIFWGKQHCQLEFIWGIASRSIMLSSTSFPLWEFISFLAYRSTVCVLFLFVCCCVFVFFFFFPQLECSLQEVIQKAHFKWVAKLA